MRQVENRPGYLLKRAQQALSQACTDRLRPTGLSMSQYAALRALDDLPSASSAELARRCFVTRQSLRDVLKGLREAGLVTVAEEATSRRVKPVALTPSGRGRLLIAEQMVTEVETEMLAGLSDTDRERLTGLLLACIGNLTASV